MSDELEKLRKMYTEEKRKKELAVNKLAEVMNMMDFRNLGNKKGASTSELRKKEKECRKLQQELQSEREKCNKVIEKFQRDLSESQAALYEGGQSRTKLQMELDAKDSEIELLKQKLNVVNLDSAFVHSGSMTDGDNSVQNSSLSSPDNHMQGWLSVPNKQNIKKYGWRKQYVVVSSRKVLFYSSEADKQKSAPMLSLDIEKLHHVRSLTKGDYNRADAKDIPRIFQVLYVTEGKNRKTEENPVEINNQPKAGAIDHKGHEFIEFHFRTPITCDSCNKRMWHMIDPPNAMECRRCHFRVHKDHFDKKEEFIGYCKVNFDQNIQVKEILLLADTSEDKKTWVMHLSKKICKKGIVSQETLGFREIIEQKDALLVRSETILQQEIGDVMKDLEKKQEEVDILKIKLAICKPEEKETLQKRLDIKEREVTTLQGLKDGLEQRNANILKPSIEEEIRLEMVCDALKTELKNIKREYDSVHGIETYRSQEDASGRMGPRYANENVSFSASERQILVKRLEECTGASESSTFWTYFATVFTEMMGSVDRCIAIAGER